MSNANYLTYPEITELARMGADSGQIERSVVSWSYVQLCRQTMQDACGESMASLPMRLALGEDLGAKELAVVFLHLFRLNFKEQTGLNGPILTFAQDEFDAFGMWVTRNGITLPQPVTGASLATVTQSWIGSISAQCPRSLWLSFALKQPAYSTLRADLKSWSFQR
jgi:hypothetical protein